VDFLPIVARELNVRGSYAYSDDDFQRSIELLASGQVEGEPMLSVAPLAQGPEAFEALVTDPADRIKVLLQPT
jgi:threonine dehydrogenase-like Zn-dependent dehydrogenase